ncbi:M28 family peptidase [bacterium]|nr:M28 family peptidase [candidate division CSSED10-310 bacterium]
MNSRPVSLATELYPHTSGMAPNVIAVQEGQINPAAYWIVCGHIDSITYNDPMTFAPGADDNGTGFALLIIGDGGYSTSAGMQFTVTAKYFECPIVVFDLDENPGWTVTGQWAWGQPTGGSGDHGAPDPTSGYTGSTVYGYNLNGGYVNNMPEYTLTTEPLDFNGIFDAEIQFARWLGVESSEYDHARIQVSLDGTSFSNIWENGATIDDGE